MNVSTIGVAAGWILIIAGIIISLVAVVMIVFRGRWAGGRFRGGGLIMLGPIPIIFGTDRESVKVLIILSIILIATMLIFIITISFLSAAG